MSGDHVAIQVDGLGKSYARSRATANLRPLDRWRLSARTERFWAFRNVSFDVSRGEALGVVGDNGAGKSTLLRVLARITRPNEGRAVLNGTVGTMISVATGFHPEMTGRENIMLSAALLGMSPSAVADGFDGIVEHAGVADWIDTPLKRYSTGMLMRLGFAIAAGIPNDIVLVDEALAVGDESFRCSAVETLLRRADQGAAVLLVSHDLDLVERTCGRVLWLDEGTICAFGPASEVVTRYRAARQRT